MSKVDSFALLLASSGERLKLTRDIRGGAHEVFVWQGGSIKLILSTFCTADADAVMQLAL